MRNNLCIRDTDVRSCFVVLKLGTLRRYATAAAPFAATLNVGCFRLQAIESGSDRFLILDVRDRDAYEMAHISSGTHWALPDHAGNTVRKGPACSATIPSSNSFSVCERADACNLRIRNPPNCLPITSTPLA